MRDEGEWSRGERGWTGRGVSLRGPQLHDSHCWLFSPAGHLKTGLHMTAQQNCLCGEKGDEFTYSPPLSAPASSWVKPFPLGINSPAPTSCLGNHWSQMWRKPEPGVPGSGCSGPSSVDGCHVRDHSVQAWYSSQDVKAEKTVVLSPWLSEILRKYVRLKKSFVVLVVASAATETVTLVTWRAQACVSHSHEKADV